MDASVVICSRNHARGLARVLDSAARMHVPEGTRWELIVVDNGSTDETSAVVERYASVLPVRRAFEPKAGHSNARNKGVAEARGAYVIWTDDDVEVDPDWLAAYLDAFKRWPQTAVFGGRILPVLEEPAVDWFAANIDNLRSLLAYRDFGDEPFALSEEGDRLPFGANYAVRIAEQKLHTYDPELGLGPNHRRIGEETDVICSILSAGGTGVWVPGAIVRHLISRARQTEEYICAYYKGLGETRTLTSPRNASMVMAKAPLRLWLGFAYRYAMYRSARAMRSKSWIPALVTFSLRAGELDCWRRRA